MSLDQDLAWKAVRRFLVVFIMLSLVIIFALWRTDNQRVERFRHAILDEILPNTDFLLKPIAVTYRMVSDFSSYTKLYQQNQDLKRELQKMAGWKEAALQLEEKNAQLSILNNVKLDPMINWVTGLVVADSGSPFNQSTLLNVGIEDGVKDGSATMGGVGLVGRISGVGESISRVILITDVSSSIPVVIQKTGQRGLVIGDNSLSPTLDFLENSKGITAGMRVITSGQGRVLPPNLFVGNIAVDSKGQLRVILAAKLKELNYLRVLIENQDNILSEPGNLIFNKK